MTQNRYIVLLIISIGLVFSACQKEDVDIFLPDNRQGLDTNWIEMPDPSMPVSFLKKDLIIPGYTDSVELSNGSTELISASGLLFLFPENCVMNDNSQQVTGKVIVQNILLQKKGDFIRLDKSTESNKSVISSTGMLFINLKKDGALLQLTPHAKLNIQYPKIREDSTVSLYYGNDSSGNGILDWNLNKDNSNTINSSNYNYEINTNRLGWISAGHATGPDSLNNTIVQAKLASQFTNANSIAWLVFKKFNSVISLKANLADKKFLAKNIPPNQEATLIVISKQVNDYYLGTTEIITSESNNILSVAVSPIKTSLDAVVQYLNSL